MDCDGVGAHADGAGVRTRVRLRLRRAENLIQGPIQNDASDIDGYGVTLTVTA